MNLAYQNFDKVTVIPGIPETLCQLAQKGNYHLAIVTSKTSQEYQKHFRDQYRFARYFKVVVTADMTEKHKPSPEPIKRALEDLQAIPQEAMYIGDMVTDQIAAHDAGVKFAGASYGSVSPDDLKDADYILNQPQDILKLLSEDPH